MAFAFMGTGPPCVCRWGYALMPVPPQLLVAETSISLHIIAHWALQKL